jgi:hypothetical protein
MKELEQVGLTGDEPFTGEGMLESDVELETLAEPVSGEFGPLEGAGLEAAGGEAAVGMTSKATTATGAGGTKAASGGGVALLGLPCGPWGRGRAPPGPGSPGKSVGSGTYILESHCEGSEPKVDTDIQRRFAGKTK